MVLHPRKGSDTVMDINNTLMRIVEEYRQKYDRYPGRILLKGEAAQAFADRLARRHENSELAVVDLNKRTPDELFINGGMAWFKSIPVIAELPSEREIVVDWAE